MHEPLDSLEHHVAPEVAAWNAHYHSFSSSIHCQQRSAHVCHQHAQLYLCIPCTQYPHRRYHPAAQAPQHAWIFGHSHKGSSAFGLKQYSRTMRQLLSCGLCNNATARLPKHGHTPGLAVNLGRALTFTRCTMVLAMHRHAAVCQPYFSHVCISGSAHMAATWQLALKPRTVDNAYQSIDWNVPIKSPLATPAKGPIVGAHGSA